MQKLLQESQAMEPKSCLNHLHNSLTISGHWFSHLLTGNHPLNEENLEVIYEKFGIQSSMYSQEVVDGLIFLKITNSMCPDLQLTTGSGSGKRLVYSIQCSADS